MNHYSKYLTEDLPELHASMFLDASTMCKTMATIKVEKGKYLCVFNPWTRLEIAKGSARRKGLFFSTMPPSSSYQTNSHKWSAFREPVQNGGHARYPDEDFVRKLGADSFPFQSSSVYC